MSDFDLKRTTSALKAANGWLGWGDPAGGVWFIGIEEGATFTGEKISAMRGRRYQSVGEERERNTPVAIRTAKIVCALTGCREPVEYPSSRMGWKGSRVFNGNLFPLGKPAITEWPGTYKDLLGLTRDEYLRSRDSLQGVRRKLWQKFRTTHRPQAIVCFGKSHWRDFEELFVRPGAVPSRPDRRQDIIVYKSDRVILTPHFSRHMSNRAVDCVVRVLSRWKVALPR